MLSKNESNPILIIIRQLLLIIDSKYQLGDKDAVKNYYQILRAISTESGFRVMNHVLTYGGFTETEIMESYDLNKDKVNRIVSTLKKAKIIRQVGKINSPYSTGPGNRAKIYLLDGSPPECAHEAQRRFGEIMKARGGEKMDQKTLDEAFNLVKVYLEKREINQVPETQIIKRILSENEIKGVEIPLIVNRLRKEGYKW